MPPFTGWYRGAENIGWLIDTQCPGGAHDMPMLPTTANGQPAFGLYMRDAGRRLQAVPPAGARPRRRPGAARRAFFELGAVREVRAARPAPRRPWRPTAPRPGDRGPRPRTGAARAGAGLHPDGTVGGRGGRTAADPPRARDGAWPTCWPTWTTRSTPSPRRPAARSAVEVPRRTGCRPRGAAAQGLRPARRVERPDAPAASSSATSRLPTDLLVATAALEITVHGWDVAQATGLDHPLPDDLARRLLPVARRMVADEDRAERFSAPVRPLPAPAGRAAAGLPRPYPATRSQAG